MQSNIGITGDWGYRLLGATTGVTGGYKMHGIQEGYRGLHGSYIIMGGYMRLQGRLHGIRGLQGATWDYRRLHGVTGIVGTLESELPSSLFQLKPSVFG
jgi:hypothetical protein